MELLHKTNIDFMKYRRFWITVSIILVALGISAIVGGMLGVFRINFGIDFAGGTQMTLRFREQPPVDEIRTLLEQNGMRAAQIQRFGSVADNSVIIKTAVSQGTEEGSRAHIEAALDKKFNQGQAGKADLNRIGAPTLAGLLLQMDPDGVRAQGNAANVNDAARAHYDQVAKNLLETRRVAGIFTGWDQVRGQGVSPAVTQALQQRTYVGDFAVLGVENVGPQIGSELRKQGFWAVAFSLLAMLCYIWFRFELRFGIGAIMATIHDVIVTFGLFVLCGFEFNLISVAAFLTLIGYSVNDTVVIFDRMRENMRKTRRKPLIELMNDSLNQTLSRTIMTSGLTMLTVAALLVLGGDVLRGFAFVMTVGIIVGTYSSIYVASPFALLWDRYFGPQAKVEREGRGLPAATASSGPKPTAVPPSTTAPTAPTAPTRRAPAARKAR